MNITFACPACEAGNRAELTDSATELSCSHCGKRLQVPAGAIAEGRVRRCVVCPSTDLFVRKDFPQRVGVSIVTLGILASCVAWAKTEVYLTFAILFATAAIDVILYFIVPNALMCYRCGAMYRGVAGLDEHESFDLETHERYRQQKIRLAELQKPGVRSQEAGARKQEAGVSQN